MNHAYTSLNKALIAAWATIAPGSACAIVDVNSPAPPPVEGLRIVWQDDGQPTRTPGEYVAQVDLAIITPPPAGPGGDPSPKISLQRQTALDQALGFQGMADGNGGDGTGRVARWDYTASPPVYLSSMDVLPEGGWESLPSGSAGTVMRARTIRLRFRTNKTLPFG